MEKTKLKRLLLTGALLAGIAAVNPLSAVPFTGSSVAVEAATAPSDDTQADQIGYKYRSINGYLQKRRWNYTKGVWVDPYWTPA